MRCLPTLVLPVACIANFSPDVYVFLYFYNGIPILQAKKPSETGPGAG